MIERKLFTKLIAASTAAAVAEIFFLEASLLYRALIIFITLAFPSLLAYFYYSYAKERRARGIEQELPSALLQISSFPTGTALEQVIESIAKASHGELSKEFRKALNQVKTGLSASEALEEMIERSESLLFKKTIAMLLHAYKSGADLSSSLREVAEDVLELQAISREGSASLAIQKYTLLIGGGIIVPLILALLLGVVSSLDIQLEGFSSITNAERIELIEASVFANQAYLIIFAFLASYFVAMQEGSRKKAIVYFALVAPVSLLIFNLVKEFKLIA